MSEPARPIHPLLSRHDVLLLAGAAGLLPCGGLRVTLGPERGFVFGDFSAIVSALSLMGIVSIRRSDTHATGCFTLGSMLSTPRLRRIPLRLLLAAWRRLLRALGCAVLGRFSDREPRRVLPTRIAAGLCLVLLPLFAASVASLSLAVNLFDRSGAPPPSRRPFETLAHGARILLTPICLPGVILLALAEGLVSDSEVPSEFGVEGASAHELLEVLGHLSRT